MLLIFACEKNAEKRKIKLSNGTTNKNIDQQLTSTVRFAARERRTIAVMYFQNLTGDANLQWLQKGLTEMFIRGLSQSSNLSVLSMDRLTEILRRLGREGTTKTINLEIAALVAREANVEAVLLGHISKKGDNLQINIKLQESEQGKIFKEESVEGSGLENIFNMVDNLTQTVKSDLQLALGKAEQDVGIAELTTTSVEAWQQYTTGTDLVDNFEHNEAIPHFEKAIQLDSTFVSAYLDLCGAYFTTGKNEAAFKIYQKLLQLKDQATPQEQYQIDLLDADITNDAEKYIYTIETWIKKYPDDRDAHYTLSGLYWGWNNHEKAIKHLKKAVQIDPKFGSAYNRLGYSYANLGRLEKAISAIKKYQELSPDKTNPYDSMGEIYFMLGEFDNAEKQLKQALRIDKGFYHSIRFLGLVYLNTGRHKKALKFFKKLLENSEDRFQRAGAYNLLARTYLKLDNPNKVLEMYQKSLDENIFNFNAVEIIRHIYLMKQDSASAQAALQKIYEQIKAELSSETTRENALNFLSGLSIAWDIRTDETIEIITAIFNLLQNTEHESQNAIKLNGLKFILTLLYQQTGQTEKMDELWPEGEFLPSILGKILQSVRDFSYSNQTRSFGRLNKLFYGYTERGIEFYNYFIDFSINNKIQQFEMICRLLLADIYLKSGNNDLANHQLKIVGMPEEVKWKTISPFENKDGFRKKLPPEKDIRLDKTYKNDFGKIAWKSADDGINDGFINFNDTNRIYNWAVGYGLIYIDSPDEKEVQFRFGTDDEVKIWLNDTQIWLLFQGGPAVFDDNKVNVKLKKGLNKVLIKVCNSVSDWGFFFRITDENGIGVPDIKFVSADEVL